MRYFRSDGRRYRDAGAAMPGTRARKTVFLSVATVVVGTAVFDLFFFSVMKEEGLNMMPILLILAAFSVFSIGVVAFLTMHHLGGGGVSIDMRTGRVELRDKTGSVFSRTRLERSDVQEVAVTRRVTDSGIKFTVRIVSRIGDHVAGILDDEGDAGEFGGELASLLAVPLRDRTSGQETTDEAYQKVVTTLKQNHPLLFRLIDRLIKRNR